MHFFHSFKKALPPPLFQILATRLEGMELLGDIKEECIDNYTEKFINIFQKTLNIHAPLQKQSRKEKKLKNKHGYPEEFLYQSSKKIYCTKEPLN